MKWLCCLALISSPVMGYLLINHGANIHINRHVLTILEQVYQPMFDEEQLEILEEATFKNMDTFNYMTQRNTTWLVEPYFKQGLFLPKGENFSPFNQEHLYQAQILKDALISTQDSDQLFKFLIWARDKMNEDMFIFVLNWVIITGNYFDEVILPPPYEVNPFFFFSSEVIQKAQNFKSSFEQANDSVTEYHTIFADYSTELNDSVPYFTEDVGLNAYYYFYTLKKAFDSQDVESYFFYQQLLARYYLERLSNDLGKVSGFDWFEPFNSPYNPNLRYFNGKHFSERPSSVNLRKYYFNYAQWQLEKASPSAFYVDILTYEKQIEDLIESGHFESSKQYYYEPLSIDVHDDKGLFFTLFNLLSGKFEMSNPKHFEAIDFIYRKTLVYSHTKANQDVPAALEQYETSLRDPAFFNLYTKIFSYLKLLQSKIGPYSETEIQVKNVTITHVTVSNLTTFFEPFLSDITNCVYLTPDEIVADNFKVYAKQKRLNNDIFNYKIVFKSEFDQPLIVSAFIGPKYDELGKEISFSEGSDYFFRLDRHYFTATVGENVIKRYSFEFEDFTPDLTTFDDIYHQIDEHEKNYKIKFVPGHDDALKLPRRLMLPKGKEHGLAYQFFVYIQPRLFNVEKRDIFQPYTFPLNRQITNETLWMNLPNAHLQEVKIFHAGYIERN